MKKLIVLLVVLVGFMVSYAGELALSQAAGPYEWEFVDTIADTIRVSTTATDTLFKDVVLKQGCGYALAIRDSLVTDSAVIKVLTYVDKGGTQYGLATADNISPSDATYPYVVCDLPVGFTTIGNFFTVTVTGLSGSSQKTILKAALYRYRKWGVSIPYNTVN